MSEKLSKSNLLFFDSEKNFDDYWDSLSKSTLNKKHQYLNTHMNQEPNICTNCFSSQLIKHCQNSINDDYTVCYDCGYVKEMTIDTTSCFENDDGIGAIINYYYPKSSLGTSISGPNSRVKIINQWNLQPYEEKTLQEIFKEIETICRQHKISKPIINNALNLYKKVNDCKHTHGKNQGKKVIKRRYNLIGLKAACIYLGCKLQKQPKSITFVANMFNISPKNLSKGIKTFLVMLRISNDDMYFQLGTITPSDYVIDFCSSLNIKQEHTKIAITICNNIELIQIATDHQPTSVAAVSILLMAQLNNISVTKKDIKQMFEISEVTLNKIYNKTYYYLGIVINSEITKQFIDDLYKNI